MEGADSQILLWAISAALASRSSFRRVKVTSSILKTFQMGNDLFRYLSEVYLAYRAASKSEEALSRAPRPFVRAGSVSFRAGNG